MSKNKFLNCKMFKYSDISKFLYIHVYYQQQAKTFYNNEIP